MTSNRSPTFFIAIFTLMLHIKAEDGESPLTCPVFSALTFWLRRQCPPIRDLRCANGLPCDVASPSGQLNCGLVDATQPARLQLVSADEFLRLVKQRDPYGRPQCLLTLFYSPDCVFSAKVADTIFRVAALFPKLRVLAVDVTAGGKGNDGLISHYGISSTPVIALWQDGFPRYRLYEDYSRLETLVRVLKIQTDLHPLRMDEMTNDGAGEHSDIGTTNEDEMEQKHSREPTLHEFLGQFRYLREDLGFDWYLLASVLTCAGNALYFLLSSQKGKNLLRQLFPRHFAIVH